MARAFTLVFSEEVKKDLANFRTYDRRILLEVIEMQLSYAPHIETKQRKCLHNLVPPFEATPSIWQLRVGNFRVFYDVSEEERKVSVRAIRLKPAHVRTEEIL